MSALAGDETPATPATPDDVETLAWLLWWVTSGKEPCPRGDVDLHVTVRWSMVRAEYETMARRLLASDWLADRLAAARREGAAVALARVEALATRFERPLAEYGFETIERRIAVDYIRTTIAQSRDATS